VGPLKCSGPIRTFGEHLRARCFKEGTQVQTFNDEVVEKILGETSGISKMN